MHVSIILFGLGLLCIYPTRLFLLFPNYRNVETQPHACSRLCLKVYMHVFGPYQRLYACIPLFSLCTATILLSLDRLNPLILSLRPILIPNAYLDAYLALHGSAPPAPHGYAGQRYTSDFQ